MKHFVVVLLCLLASPALASPVIDAGPPPDAQVDDGLTTSPSKDVPAKVVVVPEIRVVEVPPATHEVIDWLATLSAIASLAVTGISIYVASTPSTDDDAWWAAVLQRFSVLRALNIPNGVLGRLSFPGTRPKPPGGV